MDFSKIINFVEKNVSTLARAYYDQIKKSELMFTYKKLDDTKVLARE